MLLPEERHFPTLRILYLSVVLRIELRPHGLFPSTLACLFLLPLFCSCLGTDVGKASDITRRQSPSKLPVPLTPPAFPSSFPTMFSERFRVALETPYWEWIL